MQDLGAGSWKLGVRTPRLFTEIVARYSRECLPLWDSNRGLGGWWACTLSVPNIYGERRDLGPGAALRWTFICMLGQTTSDSGVWVQGPSCEDLAQRQHRVHLFDHLGGEVEASALLCHIP